MRKFTVGFRKSLRGINEINTIISYKSDKKNYILTTESEDEIVTELNDFIETESSNYIINQDENLLVNPGFNADLFKTICKTLEIETKENIPIGTKINVKIGVKVNNSFEYMDYGYYYIKENSYNANENYYHVIAYDKMYKSMISYDNSKINIEFPITIKNLLIKICDYLNWNYDFDNFINSDKKINNDLFGNQNLTYRDILDNISQVIVGNLMFDENETLKVKYATETNELIEEDDLKNINVDIKEKYGPVNSLLITTNDNVVLNNLNDETSINNNGKTEFKINDNYILINNSDDFIDEMFNKINGLEYYIYDINTIGLLIFEVLDKFSIKINDNIYPTLLLNDDLNISAGIKEDCYVDKPKINVEEYNSTNKDKNKLNNALISIDKANAEIQLKANKADVEASLELKVSKDDNDQAVSMINASADIVELKGNRVVIDSTNFKVDKNGNIDCNNAKMKNAQIVGGNIEIQDSSGNKLATLDTNGMSFFKNNTKLIQMGSQRFTGEEPLVGKYDYLAATTEIFRDQALMWLRQSYSDSNTFTPILRLLNDSENPILTFYEYTLFNNSVEFGQPITGSLSFYDTTNAGVITTDLSKWSTLYVSRIVGNGEGGIVFSTFLGDLTVKASLSDKRLKKNIKESSINAIDEIKKIKHYSFDWKENNKHINNGYIAQELEKIDKDLVIKNKDEKALYQIDILNLLSLTTKAIQEQQEQIENLQKQVSELKEMIKNG